MKTLIIVFAMLVFVACNNVSMEQVGMTKGVITSVEDLNRAVSTAPMVLVDTTGDGVADIICDNTFTRVYDGGVYDPRGMEVDVRIFADSCRNNYRFNAYLRKSKTPAKFDTVPVATAPDSL